MMRRLFGLVAAAGLITGVVGSASGETFDPSTSTMVLKISGLASIVVPANPTATATLYGQQGIINTGTIWQTTGFGPGTSLFTGVPLISNLTLTATNGQTGPMTGRQGTKSYSPPGTPNPVGPGTIGFGPLGRLPLSGQAKVKFLGGAKIPAPLSVLGPGGTLTLDLSGAGIITVTGGPWITGKIVMTSITTNIISLPDRSGTVTGNAFTLDPPNTEVIKTFTTLGGFITSNPNGILKVQNQVTLVGSNQITDTTGTGPFNITFVAPMRIDTGNLVGTVPGQMKLTYAFTPEPTALVLLGVGAVGLAVIGRKRMKK